MELLATQCPRLRRLSGRAAALDFPCLVAEATFPGCVIPRGDSLLAWRAPAPHSPWPPYPPQRAFARKALRGDPYAGGWSLDPLAVLRLNPIPGPCVLRIRLLLCTYVDSR